jgi:hypothetical protein
MIRRVGLAACALVLLAVTAGSAQQVVTGTVVRIDQPASVVVLDNGQMYQATPQTVFLVNNQPTNFAAIRPGTPVVVQYGQPVAYREGRYVVVSQSVPPGTVVAAPAPAAVATLPPNGIYEVSGIVRWVSPGSDEPGHGRITLDDGRAVVIDQNTQVLANGAPAMLSTLKPGTFVVVRSSKPLSYRNGTYYTTPVAVVSPAPGAVVMTPPNVISGTVIRFDQPNSIVLSDGRVIPATQQTVVMVDNHAVPIATLRPGTNVVIYPNGQAIVADPYAFPAAYPEMGLREQANERNSP